MKKIIIFEDSLENTVAYVNELDSMDLVSEISILLYGRYVKTVQQKIDDMRDRFPKETKIEPVTLWNYEERLDYYYYQTDTLFLFDMNLADDGSTVFDNRINVMYAKKKRSEVKRKHPKIWFYTTTKAEQRAILLEQFPECTLSVKSIGRNGVLLDFGFKFMQALKGEE